MQPLKAKYFKNEIAVLVEKKYNGNISIVIVFSTISAQINIIANIHAVNDPRCGILSISARISEKINVNKFNEIRRFPI